jgi:hypothetical protein
VVALGDAADVGDGGAVEVLATCLTSGPPAPFPSSEHAPADAATAAAANTPTALLTTAPLALRGISLTPQGEVAEGFARNLDLACVI